MRYLLLHLIALCGAAAGLLPAGAAPPVLDAPPIPWATPLGEGPIKVLYIAPRFATWDAHALEERLEMELTVVPVWQARNLGYDPALLEEHTPGFAAEEVTVALEDALRKPRDLYILANLDPAMLPEAVLSEIVTRVAQGAGLLLNNLAFYGHGPLEVVLDSAEAPDPALAGELVTGANIRGRAKDLRLGLVNAGRIAEFVYPESPPKRLGLLPGASKPVLYDPAYLDESLSLVARAALWAAGRDREIRISGLTDQSPAGPNPDEIPPDLPEAYIDSLQDLPMQQPMRPFVVTLSAPAPRKMTLRLQVRERGRPLPAYAVSEEVHEGQQEITTFLYLGTGRLTVDAWLETRKGIVDWASREIEVDDWPELQAIRADKTWLLPNDRLQLNLRVRPVHSQYRNATVYARATDNHGRIVGEVHAFVGAEGGEVPLAFEFADLIAPLVTVEIYAIAGQQPAPSSFVLGVHEADRLYFPVRLADDTPGLQLVAATPDTNGPATVAYLHALAAAGVNTVYAPAGDDAFLQSAAAELRLIPELGAWRAGRAVDGTKRDPCLSDAAYRNTEARRVSDAALVHWAGGSGRYGLGNPSYFSASDAPLCQAPACSAGFLGSGLDTAAPWETNPDFWIYRTQVFSEFLSGMARATRQIDAEGAAGFRAVGSNAKRFGYDWRELFTGLDWIAVDPDPVINHKLRSYADPHSFSGIVLGDRVRPDSDEALRARVWRGALEGFGSLWLHQPFGTVDSAAPAALLSEDASATAALSLLAETVAEVNACAGPLLARATPAAPLIGLIESPQAAYAAQLDDATTDDYAATEAAMAALLDQLGYAWRFLQMDDLGAPGTESIRALFLPQGALYSPAQHTRLAAAASSEMLLFANAAPANSAVPWTDLGGDETAVSKAWTIGAPDAAGRYHHRLEALSTVLAAAGLETMVPLDTRGSASAGLRTFRFRYGSAEIYAVYAEPGYKSSRLALPFEKGDAVYDLRDGTAVLRPHKNYIRLDAGDATLFSRLPYAVQDVEMIAPEAVSAGGRLPVQCLIGAGDGKPGDHLVRAELAPINGDAKPWHTIYITCRNGAGSSYIPLARNIPLGHYTLRVYDFLSGVTSTQDLKIVPPAAVGGTQAAVDD